MVETSRGFAVLLANISGWIQQKVIFFKIKMSRRIFYSDLFGLIICVDTRGRRNETSGRGKFLWNVKLSISHTLLNSSYQIISNLNILNYLIISIALRTSTTAILSLIYNN